MSTSLHEKKTGWRQWTLNFNFLRGHPNGAWSSLSHPHASTWAWHLPCGRQKWMARKGLKLHKNTPKINGKSHEIQNLDLFSGYVFGCNYSHLTQLRMCGAGFACVMCMADNALWHWQSWWFIDWLCDSLNALWSHANVGARYSV